MSTIAFIGVGRMGSRIARRLVDAGHVVRVNDLDQSTAASLIEAGATWCASAADAGHGAEWLLLSLPNPAAVIEASVQALERAPAGATMIDFSTVGPRTARICADACGARAVNYLDAPVSGGVRGAAEGQLTIMVGGDEATLDGSHELLDGLAKRIVHCGPVGSGQLAKLCHNLLAAIHATAASEVLAAGVKAGGDLRVLVDVMSSGMAGSSMLTLMTQRTFTDERPSNFTLELMRKDVMLCLDELSDAPMPVAHAVSQLFNTAMAEGLAQADSTGIVELYERWDGLRLQLPGEDRP